MKLLAFLFYFLVPALIVFFTVNSVHRRFYAVPTVGGGNATPHRWFRNVSGRANIRLLIESGAVAVVAGLVNWLSPRLSGWTVWLSLLFILMMAAAFVGLFIWWHRRGYTFREMISFIILDLMFALVLAAATSVLAGMIRAPFWASLVSRIPWLVFFAFLGYMFAGNLIYRWRQSNKTLKRCLVWGIIVAVVIGLIFVWILVGAFHYVGLANNNAPKTTIQDVWQDFLDRFKQPDKTDPSADVATTPSPSTTPQPTVQPTAKPTLATVLQNWIFRHFSVIKDDIVINDYDFGNDPLEEILKKKIANGELTLQDVANKSLEELFKLVTLDELMTEWVHRMGEDPALGVACVAWWDVNMHTRLLGEFWSRYQDDPDGWMEFMNAKVEEFVYDKPAYFVMLSEFVDCLEHSTITLTHATSGLNDQMYMFGLSDDDIPDIIVLESRDLEGWFLTITNYVKSEDNMVSFSYRVSCGFQPTNVAEKTGVKPAPNPYKLADTGGGGGGSTPPDDTGSGGGGTPTNPGGGGGGTPPSGGGGTPPTDWWPPYTPDLKDPSEGSTPGGNDDHGITGDADTNNGVGAWYSAAEESEDSTFYWTFEEYYEREKMVETESEATRAAGESNTPTTKTPADADTDSNAAAGGTGYGGADTPSENNGPANLETPDGQDHTNTEKVDWEGPAL